MHQKQTELWIEPVNLARRIPEDHRLRKLNMTLDLSFVREEVVSGERELIHIIPLRIDYL